jgi:hypothetical protein
LLIVPSGLIFTSAWAKVAVQVAIIVARTMADLTVALLDNLILIYAVIFGEKQEQRLS